MNRIYIMALSLILISCTKEIEIDIPKEKPKLVVYATLTPFSFLKPKLLDLTLQSSSHIFDTATHIVNDALVLYYENDLLKDTLRYTDELNSYIISNSMSDYPVVGAKYSIQIIKNGYETITSSTIIPAKVNITDAVITPIAYFDDTGSVFSEIAITFTDPADEENYYELAVSHIAFSYDNAADFYALSTPDNLITSESYYPSLIRFDVDKPKYLLFTDKKINGMQHTFHIYYSPPQYEDEHRYISAHYISIHLRNVTPDYYKFKTSMIQHLYSKKEDILYGMGEPLNVISNIENGYGLFAGFNTDIVSLHVDELIINE